LPSKVIATSCEELFILNTANEPVNPSSIRGSSPTSLTPEVMKGKAVLFTSCVLMRKLWKFYYLILPPQDIARKLRQYKELLKRVEQRLPA
jgi:hypothetical protein